MSLVCTSSAPLESIRSLFHNSLLSLRGCSLQLRNLHDYTSQRRSSFIHLPFGKIEINDPRPSEVISHPLRFWLLRSRIDAVAKYHRAELSRRRDELCQECPSLRIDRRTYHAIFNDPTTQLITVILVPILPDASERPCVRDLTTSLAGIMSQQRGGVDTFNS